MLATIDAVRSGDVFADVYGGIFAALSDATPDDTETWSVLAVQFAAGVDYDESTDTLHLGNLPVMTMQQPTGEPVEIHQRDLPMTHDDAVSALRDRKAAKVEADVAAEEATEAFYASIRDAFAAKVDLDELIAETGLKKAMLYRIRQGGAGRLKRGE
jgi:hypothetical protein